MGISLMCDESTVAVMETSEEEIISTRIDCIATVSTVDTHFTSAK